MRALVVDDSRAARALVSRMLKNLGVDSTPAEEGATAIEVLGDGEGFDIALVDWNMPVMDGLEFVRHIREQRRFATLPIMMISSESDPKRMARALIAGADEYLVKPFDVEMLSDKLAGLGLLDGQV